MSISFFFLQTIGRRFRSGARRNPARPRMGTNLPTLRFQPQGSTQHERRLTDAVHTFAAEADPTRSIDFVYVKKTHKFG